MTEKEFNLLDEPWIKVMKDDCTVEEVSLVDALVRSHEYTRLAGELPTQDVAILRLLLAVLHTIVYRMDENGNEKLIENREDALDRWKSIWEASRLPESHIRSYLEAWRERFWLFHPERPFYQVPEASIGTEASAAKLNGELSESNNKLKLFTSRAGKAKSELTFAEAARWLLYLNAFDDTGLKAKSEERKKEKKSDASISISRGYMGYLGIAYIDGDNLYETLMYNLVLIHNQSQCWDAPHPTWETKDIRIDELIQIAPPNNQAELLTMQSRRIILKRDGDKVSGYNILAGDYFKNKKIPYEEQMTCWKTVSTDNTEVEIKTREHDISKQMWREYANILCYDNKNLSPGVMNWVRLLRHVKLIDKIEFLTLKCVTVKYSNNSGGSNIEDTAGDYLNIHSALVDDMGATANKMIEIEIQKCDEVADKIGKFAEDLCRASRSLNDNDKDYIKKIKETAKGDFYFEIDTPFRQWLLGIDPRDTSKSSDDLRNEWRIQVKDIAQKIGKRMVEDAGIEAFKGRVVEKKKDKKEIYTAPRAYNNYLYQIKQCYES